MQLSFDFPFRGFHTLEACYSYAGQEVYGPVSREVVTTQSGARITVHRAVLLDSIAQKSILMYINIDSSTADVAMPLPSLLGTAWERPPVVFHRSYTCRNVANFQTLA